MRGSHGVVGGGGRGSGVERKPGARRRGSQAADRRRTRRRAKPSRHRSDDENRRPDRLREYRDRPRERAARRDGLSAKARRSRSDAPGILKTGGVAGAAAGGGS